MPKEAKVTVRFQAAKTFHAEETSSTYVKGQFYSVRDGEPWAKLAKLVGTPEKPGAWAKDGRIVFGGPAAEVSGG